MHILDCPDDTCPHQAEQARVTEVMEQLAKYYTDSGRDLIAVTILYALKTGILPNEEPYVQIMNGFVDSSREVKFTRQSVIESVSVGKLLHADGTEVQLPYTTRAGESLYMTIPGAEPNFEDCKIIQGNFGPGQPLMRVEIQPADPPPGLKPGKHASPDTDYYNTDYAGEGPNPYGLD